jgi:hypothetical protein
MAHLEPTLSPLEIGGGRVETMAEAGYRLTLPPMPRGYADAQLDDHRRLRRSAFPWRPPVRIRVRARASEASPIGTLGFGLWNDPFSLSLGQGGAARRLPTAPRAIWFFYASPPADLSLSPGAPPNGWKASCLDSPSVPALLLAPVAAAGLAAAQIPFLRRTVLKRALGGLRGSEVPIAASLADWHEYEILWRGGRALFKIDGEVVLEAAAPLTGPLGFVAWIDNQYAVASPEKGFHFGVLATSREQGLELSELSVAVVPSTG